MPKKEKGGRSRTTDKRKPRVATTERKEAQRQWRLGCLAKRTKEGRLTAKNELEIARLGI